MSEDLVAVCPDCQATMRPAGDACYCHECFVEPDDDDTRDADAGAEDAPTQSWRGLSGVTLALANADASEVSAE